jgi:hypothetical protein
MSFRKSLQLCQRALDGCLLGASTLSHCRSTFPLVHQRVGVVSDLGLFATLAVVFGVCLGVADHLVDVLLVESRLTSDGHRLLFAGGAVFGADMHDAVGIDVEGDFDLRNTAGRGRQVDELELAECLVVPAISLARSTWISTLGCMSSAVVNTSVRLVGMVVAADEFGS